MANAKQLEKSSLSDLSKVSARLGSNPFFVQAAGGNTSIKEKDTLWIKASGKHLSDASQTNVFVPVDLAQVHRDIGAGADSYRSLYTNGLRPSIETTLHALIPHRVVLHTHPVSVIAQSLMPGSRNHLSALLKGVSWAWIPYQRPGQPLTRAIDEVLKTTASCDVLVLANHGLVVGGDTCETAEALHHEICARLDIKPRPLATADRDYLNQARAAIPHSRLPDNMVTHSLATDAWSLKLAQCNPPYPDHVVFCGTRPLVIRDLDSFAEEAERFERAWGYKASYALFPSRGVVLLESASRSTDAMLQAQAEVFLRVSPDSNVSLLTDGQCSELMNWEAEKYRKSLESVSA